MSEAISHLVPRSGRNDLFFRVAYGSVPQVNILPKSILTGDIFTKLNKLTSPSIGIKTNVFLCGSTIYQTESYLTNLGSLNLASSVSYLVRWAV